MSTELDYFNRQKRIPGWNQSLIEQQVCFCLGVGGLGCTVALDLVRLGVKKLFLLDKDTVDYHNLNRQILFSKEDIGKPKVEAAKKALEKHNLRTELVAMHMDVLKNWDKVVIASKECNILFNMIDVGEYLDVALQSLALKAGASLCLGGTFRSTITVDFFTAKGKPCWNCISDIEKKIVKSLTPEKIDSYESIEFIPRNNNPIGESNVFVCCTCSNIMVSHFIQNLNNIVVPSRSIFYFETYEIEKWKMEPTIDCCLCYNIPLTQKIT